MRSAEQVLTRLAHDYGLRDGWAVTWKRPRGDRVAIVMGNGASAPSMRRRGIDCDDGSGVRLPFTVRIGVTKSLTARLKGRRNVRRRRTMPAASAVSETRHPRWERCIALIGAI